MAEKTLMEDLDRLSIGSIDEYGDLDANAPNPINPTPSSNVDCPTAQPTTDSIENMGPPVAVSDESHHMTRPPVRTSSALGPYYQFLTTDLHRMLWLGSALILREVSYDQPHIEFSGELAIDYEWETLYDNLFNMRVYRINIAIELRDGEGDDEIRWRINWGDAVTNGVFHIARHEQKWRGGFFSCNGFDATVPEQTKSDLTFGDVWKHLDSVHNETPLHILIWGGDQIYIDFIFEDVPYLKDWVNMEWNQKWTCDFRDDLREQVEEYHFNTYIQNWERPEVKKALASVPSVMMWDDHDIFDGAGSYPPLLHDSPMMTGLFRTAQKMRLLFQHHTTVDKAREHGLFGYQAYNFLSQCGPNMVLIGADGRSERTTDMVHHSESWQMIFDRLENDVGDIKHLIILFPVPFSFVRFKLAESIFEHLKNLPNKHRNLPVVKQTNSIFGLPELYDDLLDEWTHEGHIHERNQVLVRFQDFAERRRIRVTFFSGDVHCCGISRFQTLANEPVLPVHDSRLMYQVISSAIVNIPPSRRALLIAHYVKTKWHPVPDTEEELIDFFPRLPETGRKIRHKKLLSNRNWCYFEQCEEDQTIVYGLKKHRSLHHHRHHSKHDPHRLPAIDLGPTSTHDGHGASEPPIHTHSHGRGCKERRRVDETEIGTHSLKIRLWLESNKKHKEGRQFVSYELLIPDLI